MELTPEQIKTLENDDWEIVSYNPLQLVRYAQFAGGVHHLNTPEDIMEELKRIEISRRWRESREKKLQEKLEQNKNTTFVQTPVKKLGAEDGKTYIRLGNLLTLCITEYDDGDGKCYIDIDNRGEYIKHEDETDMEFDSVQKAIDWITKTLGEPNGGI